MSLCVPQALNFVISPFMVENMGTLLNISDVLQLIRRDVDVALKPVFSSQSPGYIYVAHWPELDEYRQNAPVAKLSSAAKPSPCLHLAI